MTNTLIAVGAMILIIAGFLMFGRQAPSDTTRVNTSTEKTPVSETELDITESTETTTTVPEISNSKTLDLSSQGLTKVPSDTFNQTDIETLNLSNNSLEGSLQAEVRNLQSLRVLNLSNNNFTGVPAEIGQLKNLEVLDLSNNNLTGLPYELANLTNLRLLKLTGNNYATADLEVIKKGLSASVIIETD